MYSVSSGIGDRGFLEANGTERDEKFVVNRVSVPQEGANDTLDAFDAVRVDLRAQIGIYRLLGIGTVVDRGMLVRIKLGLGGLRVDVTDEEFLNVA